MLFSNPRVLPALLLCVGLGLMLIRGQELRGMPEWTPGELDTAVELNYALDLAREQSRDPDFSLPGEAEKAARQAQIREELSRRFVDSRRQYEQEFRQGLWMSLAGGVLMVLVLLLQQRGILKKS